MDVAAAHCIQRTDQNQEAERGSVPNVLKCMHVKLTQSVFEHLLVGHRAADRLVQ